MLYIHFIIVSGFSTILIFLWLAGEIFENKINPTIAANLSIYIYKYEIENL